MAIPTDLVQQTRDRYEQRAAKREETSTRLKTGTPLQVDTPERVERRVTRLAATEAARRTACFRLGHRRLSASWVRSDLMSVNYLEIGLQAARCVGRISIRTRTGQVRGYGTGFTVSPRLLITNNHVLDSAGSAATSRVEFNFQEDAGGQSLAVGGAQPGARALLHHRQGARFHRRGARRPRRRRERAGAVLLAAADRGAGQGARRRVPQHHPASRMASRSSSPCARTGWSISCPTSSTTRPTPRRARRGRRCSTTSGRSSGCTIPGFRRGMRKAMC